MEGRGLERKEGEKEGWKGRREEIWGGKGRGRGVRKVKEVRKSKKKGRAVEDEEGKWRRKGEKVKEKGEREGENREGGRRI